MVVPPLAALPVAIRKGTKHPTRTSGGMVKLIWSTPGSPGARPAYSGVTGIPSTYTVTSFRIVPAGGASASDPEVSGPRPVPHTVTTTPGCAGAVSWFRETWPLALAVC